MKLKIKTAGLVGITMVLFIMLLFMFIRPAILNDALRVDRKALDADAERVRTSIDIKMDYLRRLNKDWAVWDDTYLFLKGQNKDYVTSDI